MMAANPLFADTTGNIFTHTENLFRYKNPTETPVLEVANPFVYSCINPALVYCIHFVNKTQFSVIFFFFVNVVSRLTIGSPRIIANKILIDSQVPSEIN